MARRPSLKSPCVADRYASKNERIGEFSSGEIDNAGGLISLRDEVTAPGLGVLVLNLYSLTNVRVHIQADALGPQTLRAAAKLWMENNPDKSPDIFHPEPGELEALREIAQAAKACDIGAPSIGRLAAFKRLGDALVKYNGAPLFYQGKLNPTGDPYPYTPEEDAAHLAATLERQNQGKPRL